MVEHRPMRKGLAFEQAAAAAHALRFRFHHHRASPVDYFISTGVLSRIKQSLLYNFT